MLCTSCSCVWDSARILISGLVESYTSFEMAHSSEIRIVAFFCYFVANGRVSLLQAELFEGT